MKIEEAIRRLEDIKIEYGNIEVEVNSDYKCEKVGKVAVFRLEDEDIYMAVFVAKGR